MKRMRSAWAGSGHGYKTENSLPCFWEQENEGRKTEFGKDLLKQDLEVRKLYIL